MKLLLKQETSTLKSVERKKEIDEGVKLAKQVDALRETVAKEQKNLKEFRDQSLKAITVEIESKIKERDLLIADIETKKLDRIRLGAPIDLTNEWKAIDISKKEIANTQMELLTRETDIINREIVVSHFAEREKVIEEREKQSKLYLDEASKSYGKTEDVRFAMEERKRQSEIEIQSKLSVLTNKEQDLISREYKINEQTELVTADKKDLLEKGTSLIQRESKLQADIKALNARDESISEKELLTTQYNNESKVNYDKSDELCSQIKKEKSEFDTEVKNRLGTISEREQDLGYRERDLIIQKEQLEKDKVDIELEKKHIASQQETLKQAWNNIKKLRANK